MTAIQAQQLDLSLYRIRKCNKPCDAQHLHALVTQLAQDHQLPNEVTIPVERLRRDGFETSTPLFHSAFAEFNLNHNWVPVGCVVWYFAYDTWKGKTTFLETWFVQSEHRRKGLGRKLFALCVKEAYQAGSAFVEWVVMRSNMRAKQKFKSMGAHFPDNDEWQIMRMDSDAIDTFMANPL